MTIHDVKAKKVKNPFLAHKMRKDAKKKVSALNCSFLRHLIPQRDEEETQRALKEFEASLQVGRKKTQAFVSGGKIVQDVLRRLLPSSFSFQETTGTSSFAFGGAAYDTSKAERHFIMKEKDREDREKRRWGDDRREENGILFSLR